jgi:CRISPR-associated protein Cas1
MHESRDGSSAFIFDTMESERPKVDRGILEFVKSHKFHAADFVIRTDGVFRLNPAMARRVHSLSKSFLRGLFRIFRAVVTFRL